MRVSSCGSSGHGCFGDGARPTKVRLGDGVGGVLKAKEDTGKCPVGVLGRSGVVGLIGRKES